MAEHKWQQMLYLEQYNIHAVTFDNHYESIHYLLDSFLALVRRYVYLVLVLTCIPSTRLGV